MSFGDLEQHDHSNIFFLGVNKSVPRTSLTTNYIFYTSLERLHGL